MDSSYFLSEVTGYASTADRIPFWIQSNKFGIVPTHGPAVGIHTGLEKYWNISGKIQDIKPWRMGVGVEAAANMSSDVDVWLPQLYGSILLS